MALPRARKPRILILTVSHGASHQRVADALRKALLEGQPGLEVKVVDALAYCAPWFRAYYNSYEVLLKYWPALWGWIENLQHKAPSTGPDWLYRKGAQPLFRFLRTFQPDVVIATEVGMCELAALLKREAPDSFYLVAAPTEPEMDRAWAQPEVDLYTVAPGDMAAQLEVAGVSPSKILPSGLPVDPVFDCLPDRAVARAGLEIEENVPMVLVLFGGTGYGNPRRILTQLQKVEQSLQAVFIAGRNPRLKEELQRQCNHHPRFRAFGWVDNIHEWMAAADLLITKPGATTVIEAMNCGLPLLALDPLPGNEWRTCFLIDAWGVGQWVKRPQDLAPTVQSLLANPEELEHMRQNARRLARPGAAKDAATAILKLLNLPA